MSAPRLSLAITTYERPDALEAVLRSALAQRDLPDEVLVADDGSGPATAECIERIARHAPRPIRHLRQPHLGFRLTRLRNLAIAAASGDYLVFVDGDMVLHPRFIGDHRGLARRGHYTQGVRIALDARASAALLADPLRGPGPLAPGLGGLRRLYALHAPLLQAVLRSAANAVIAIKGCNQGFWRADLLAANGFEEAIEGWGPEDKELCARLAHRGVRRQTLLFGGIAWHLEHPPASRAHRAANEQLLARTLAQRRTRAERGLDAHLAGTEGEDAAGARPA
ncbi:MAG: glycosyltransferase family 2 protein [Steroidobacteraceae bacterium]|nr:glycosyltransferase family 2 protein [Steroidobacteraceae bacterium]